MSLTLNKKIFILAGESSGDYIGSFLMDGLQERSNQKLTFFGVGGLLMQKKGLNNKFDMNNLNIIGLVNSIYNYKKLRNYINLLVELIIIEKPQAVITIDSKGFSLALAKKLKNVFKKSNYQCPLIHFVPPTIWAYGDSRAKKWRQVHDGLFCLFKKEQDIFKKFNIECIYSGNPFIEKFLQEKKNNVNIEKIKSKLSIGFKKNICLLLPGSRDSEIDYILPEFINLIKHSKNKYKNLVWIIPTTRIQYPRIIKYLEIEKVIEEVKVIILDENYEILNCAHLAIACSGTITLELVLFNVPTIAVYKSDWLSAFFGRLIVDFKNVILPNFLIGKEVIPLLFQEKCTSYYLEKTLSNYLRTIQTKKETFKLASNKILSNMDYMKQQKSIFSRNSSKEIIKIIDNFYN
tara:strand:+ start:286 stop:1500 length:1215 start_codon:yes stop_codon:yes gene_type:complete